MPKEYQSIYKRDDGTKYGSDLFRSKYYCPNCGAFNVLEESGGGDYYTGPLLYCLDCKFNFAMPIRNYDRTVEIIEKTKTNGQQETGNENL